jgi:hypothetical protein
MTRYLTGALVNDSTGPLARIWSRRRLSWSRFAARARSSSPPAELHGHCSSSGIPSPQATGRRTCSEMAPSDRARASRDVNVGTSAARNVSSGDLDLAPEPHPSMTRSRSGPAWYELPHVPGADL